MPILNDVRYATGESRQRSKRWYIRFLKLTLVPFLMLMGFTSGALLREAGLPSEFGLASSLILGPGLPWLALRVLNRKLMFWYEFRPEGLAVGPGKGRWLAKYEEVGLIRESSCREVESPYLEVVTKSKSATVFLHQSTIRQCVNLLIERCPCAVWIDAEDREHLPTVLREAPDSATGRQAKRNLSIVRNRYHQTLLTLAGFCIIGLTGLGIVGAAWFGLIPVDHDTVRGPSISSLFFTIVFGTCAVLQYRQVRSWDKLCSRVNGSIAPEVGGGPSEDSPVFAPTWSEQGGNRAMGALRTQPVFDWSLPQAARLLIAGKRLVLSALFFWVIIIALLQFGLLPHATYQQRACLAAMLTAPFALAFCVWSYQRSIHAVTLYPGWLELQRGNGSEEVQASEVHALIGRRGLNLEGGDLLVLKRIIILTEDRIHALKLPHEINTALYQILHNQYHSAWRIDFHAELEPPDPDQRTGRDLLSMVRLGRYYGRQVLSTAALGLALVVGSLAGFALLVLDNKVNTESSKLAPWLIVFLILGILLVARVIPDTKVMKRLRLAARESIVA